MKQTDEGKKQEHRIQGEFSSEMELLPLILQRLEDSYSGGGKGSWGKMRPQPADFILLGQHASAYVEIKYTSDTEGWTTSAMTQTQFKTSEKAYDKGIRYFVLLYDTVNYYLIPNTMFVPYYREKKKAQLSKDQLKEFIFPDIKTIVARFLTFSETGSLEESKTIVEGL
jgi:hypothetical protein